MLASQSLFYELKFLKGKCHYDNNFGSLFHFSFFYFLSSFDQIFLWSFFFLKLFVLPFLYNLSFCFFLSLASPFSFLCSLFPFLVFCYYIIFDFFIFLASTSLHIYSQYFFSLRSTTLIFLNVPIIPFPSLIFPFFYTIIFPIFRLFFYISSIEILITAPPPPPSR